MSEPAEGAVYSRQLPRITSVSQPFWDAAREHRLVIQRSAKTGKYLFYPRVVSPFAPGDSLEWVQVSGNGRVVACTVVRSSSDREWAQAVPYVVAIVELDEGARMTTNIVDCDPDSVQPGMKVSARYDDVTPGVTLVKFAPREGSEGEG